MQIKTASLPPNSNPILAPFEVRAMEHFSAYTYEYIRCFSLKAEKNWMEALLAKYSSVKRKGASSDGQRESDVESKTKKARKEEEKKDFKSDSGPPHFLVLGAQKAGTMAAVKNLNNHPEVFCLKEPHFFDLGWHSKSVQSYRNQFRGTGKKICGEKTPELIFVDECATRIKQVCPEAKFVLMIRDPIKRAYSAWNMNRNRDTEMSPFDVCVDRNLANINEYRSHGTAEYQYVQRGFYLEQIQRWMKVFPDKNQLLIVVAEHLRGERGKGEYNKIFNHIGARKLDSFEVEDEHIGTYGSGEGTASGKISNKVEAKLKKVYRDHNEALFKFLGFRIDEWIDCREESNSSSN